MTAYTFVTHWRAEAPIDTVFVTIEDADAWPEWWRCVRHPAALRAWQQGRTGVPLVDAGMRELWHTGAMHNRVRMVVASFLTKNLLIHWQHGEQWFWDTLVDTDAASNPFNWQWVAGSGADAAPLLPRLQSGAAAGEIRQARRLRAPLGAGVGLGGLPRPCRRPRRLPPSRARGIRCDQERLSERLAERDRHHVLRTDPQRARISRRLIAAYRFARIWPVTV